jgi:hypothetical protein
MAKRLQVIMKDPEYREIQRAARSRHMSIAEWVRQALDFARRREPVGGVSKKLEIIRAAAQHDYPVTDIDDMLAEIERGYGTGTHP